MRPGIIRATLLTCTVTSVLAVSPILAYAEFTGKVVGVIEGDSIRVMHEGKAEQVRLAGIDCPERKQAFGWITIRYRKYLPDSFGNVWLDTTANRLFYLIRGDRRHVRKMLAFSKGLLDTIPDAFTPTLMNVSPARPCVRRRQYRERCCVN